MIGMNRLGKSVSGVEYIIQLIEMTLNIKKGSLVMRRDFGGSIVDLIDSRNNFDMAIKYSMIAICIMRYIPQFKISSVSIRQISDSSQEFSISGWAMIDHDWTFVEFGAPIL